MMKLLTILLVLVELQEHQQRILGLAQKVAQPQIAGGSLAVGHVVPHMVLLGVAAMTTREQTLGVVVILTAPAMAGVALAAMLYKMSSRYS